MDIALLSSRYQVRRLNDSDLPALLSLCEGNPQYYRHCPPPPNLDSLRADSVALPPGKTQADKYYLGFFEDDALIAAMDLILHFPSDDTAFIGFFIVGIDRQGQGLGAELMADCCQHLAAIGYRAIRLGYAKSNAQSESFWHKLGFEPTGVCSQQEGYTVVFMEKQLAARLEA